MRYRTSKCPYCGYILEYHAHTVKDEIGPPELPCPSCKNYYRTGAKYWSDFSSSEKNKYWIKTVFISIYSGFMYAIGITIVIVLIDEIILQIGLMNAYFKAIVYLFIISWITMILLIIYRQKGLMSYLKSDFEKDRRDGGIYKKF